MTAWYLEKYPIHLGLGASAEPQSRFPRDESAMHWYADYAERNSADGLEGRLVSHFTFSEDWTSWEMHPNGDEVVLCLSGEMLLTQEFPDGLVKQVTLGPGEYAINRREVWHTADIVGAVQALFITAGVGTEHRPR